jgi:hypothetical protein
MDDKNNQCVDWAIYTRRGVVKLKKLAPTAKQKRIDYIRTWADRFIDENYDTFCKLAKNEEDERIKEKI